MHDPSLIHHLIRLLILPATENLLRHILHLALLIHKLLPKRIKQALLHFGLGLAVVYYAALADGRRARRVAREAGEGGRGAGTAYCVVEAEFGDSDAIDVFLKTGEWRS
jgi:hypothetical protein